MTRSNGRVITSEELRTAATSSGEQSGPTPGLQEPQLAVVYLGPGIKFPPMDDPMPAGYVLRTTPTRVLGVGPW